MDEQVDRLKQASRLPHPKDEGICRTDEEALELFRKALSKSKGKCNNRFGWMIAKNNRSTIDDIVKFGVTDSYWDDAQAFPTKSHLSRKTAFEREHEQAVKRKTLVKDSVFGKFLKSKGLWDNQAESEFGQMTTEMLGRDDTYKARQFHRLLSYAKYVDMDNRFTQQCGNTMRYWMEHITLDVTEQGITKARKEMFNKELEWLAHSPDEVLQRIAEKDYSRTQNFTQALFNSGLVNANYDSAAGDELMELTKAFCEVMDHIGIGIADSSLESHPMSMPQVRINIKNVMKKAINMGKTFVKLVKQGFEPSLARDEVIDQLNHYVMVSNTKVKWQFFPLDNAPTTYDYQRKPKATTSASGSTGRRSKAEKYADAEGCIEVPGVGKLKVF